MSGRKLIGRVKEQERLDRCMRSDSAQLIIVYGRRRVGKTFLINQYFDQEFAFKITGAFEQPKNVQIRNFTNELNRKSGIKHEVPKDWIQAFDLLRDYLESLDHGKKQVVFFDELPWLDTRKSGFMASFEWFWNDWASTQDHLVFVVCGSATSWMVDHIANNKGGLFNRQTCRMYLEPFTLRETEEYLQSRDICWSRFEIAMCYMIMGGIPYYLSLLDPEISFTQNIDSLFFAKNAELHDEFEHLYRTLFTNGEAYIKVVEALSKKRRGLTRAEISEATGIAQNGALSKMLSDLKESGFIRIQNGYGTGKKNQLYRLCDYYTLFYFRFLRENYGMDPHFWSNTVDNPGRRVWSGLTFEQLCSDHIGQIKQKLGIAGVLSEESAWSSKGQPGTDDLSGAQIDLLIDRRDSVINLCEIKFCMNEFEIDKEYEMNLRNKISTFERETNCRKSIQLTMITTFGVKRNMHSGLVTNSVTLDGLFG